ncbi:MAG TPA: alpha-hydroxy acid oxidase [Ramlibacter sp.]|uniref:alpha-hydroxy acid oxidase n=1 Tax=Ramlibacter sp. TaxID=1917967 RepID=UPI002C5C1C1B|nr:alpha-hydroxy acid oxidase [Ramlibacter sp.]HVZ42819.1 alpha-hydroxy acid oxidase [Ramlibacter sp.]
MKMEVQSLPAGIANLAQHEQRARETLDPAAWAYLCGAAGRGITERANRAAWESVTLVPRVLASLEGLDTRTQLLGRAMASPLIAAPVAFQQLAHRDAEVGTALAAAAQEAGMVLSQQASTPLEAVADAVAADSRRGPLWLQMYWQADRSAVAALADRARASGYEALVLTVDSTVRSGFHLPAGLVAPNMPAAPAAQDLRSLCAAAPTWHELEWLCANAPLPVIVKGILHPDDARHARACGAAAIVVSNHGGRTLDGAAATATMLPRVAEALDGAVPLLVDGGIRSGTDVLKALALGARAVMIGRPIVWGLTNAGARGVAHVLRLLRDELEIAMAQCGCANLARVHGDLIAPIDASAQSLRNERTT